MSDETQLIGVIDMVIRDIRDRTATRVNFVSPGAPASPSPDHKGDVLALKDGTLPGAPAEQHGDAPAPSLLFVPLPITTPLYQNARFFLTKPPPRRGDGSKETGNGDKANHLVIGIDTGHLGQLWFNIAATADSLLVKCFAEKEEVSRYIKTGFPGLQASLEELSFSRIDLLSLTDPVLEHIERPGSPGAGGLIDIEV